MKRSSPACVLLFVFIVVFGLIPSYASWQQDGIRICVRPIPEAQNPRITTDGSGGVIVTWDDERNGNKDIYAQWADSSGTAQWTDDGVAVCARADEQAYPRIVSDGAGGAIIIWRDSRNGDHDIYAQRVDPTGTIQWAADGVAICTASGNQDGYRIISDGAGGAIIVWRDERGVDADIYAQRVNASGVVQWTTDGIAVCTASGTQADPRLTPDGAGGAIIAWSDSRGGDIYAQRVDASGAIQWTSDGIAVAPATGSQSYPQIESDGAGGAIITWRDSRNGGDYDIYAQRMDASGTRQWGTEGTAICAVTGYQSDPQLTSDGAGGAIITWWDSRDGNKDIYAQWIDSAGTVQWAADGIGVCTETSVQDDPLITTDGAGGAVIAWIEDPNSMSSMIHAQRVDASGAVQWAAGGVPVCMHSDDHRVFSIISDDAGGVVVVYGDSWNNVFAQRLNSLGAVQWQGYAGLPICAGGGYQLFPAIVSDGSGGAIIAFSEHRTGFMKAYAQRVDGSGVLQWASGGVALCTADEDQYDPEICSDGTGGAIIAWGYDLYAQRVDASGVVQWAAEGVAVCAGWGGQYEHHIASDGAGGAIIPFIDSRSDIFGDVFAQRVDASGVVQWTPNGIAICTAVDYQIAPRVIPDGAGGAIITWQDHRGSYYDIYAQRVDAAGAVQWSVDGIPICTAGGSQWYPQIIPDDAGGAIITWEDPRSGNYDVYAQRVNASGIAQWTTDGIAICTAAGSQENPQIASDGIGGAFIAWRDNRSGNYDIYAQRIDASGAVQWIADGLPIRTLENNRYSPRIISDGNGGALITWSEYLIKDSDEDYDIYIQRIYPSGVLHWVPGGVPVCTREGFQLSQCLCSDGAGGAIVAWEDQRSDTTFIYADRIDSTDYQSPETCYELTVPEVLQPDSSYWSWAACSRAVLLYSGIDVDICDIADFARENNGWGEGDCCPFDPDSVCNQSNDLFGTAGSVQAILANWGVSSSDIPSALSFEDLKDYILAGSAVFAAWDDGNDANGEPHIVVVHGVCEQDVCIMNPSYENNPGLVSGWMPYDCLAAGLAHEPWTASLVADYVPTDADSPVPRATALVQNYPNPFNPTTMIPFMLHKTSNVSLTVYDVSGRLVRVIFTGRLEAGRHLKEWAGTDGNGNAAASGIYFYRLKAGDFEETRKMVLIR